MPMLNFRGVYGTGNPILTHKKKQNILAFVMAGKAKTKNNRSGRCRLILSFSRQNRCPFKGSSD